MDVVDAIRLRRAVKHFDATHRMEQAEIDSLLKLAVLSPTAFNLQHWRFVVVTEEALRQEIRSAAWGQAQVTDASLLVILCADLKAWDCQPRRYWDNAPQEVQDFILPAIDAYYRDKDQVQRDEAMRSCGIAAQTLMLAAQEMGYDSCPMDGFDFDKVGELIRLPADHVVTMFVAIGKGSVAPFERPTQLDASELVITNRFTAQ